MFKAESFKNEGNRLYGLGKLDEALQQYNLAIKSDPQMATAWHNKGMVHKKKEELINAASSFIKAIELNPDYTKAKLNLADTYLSQEKHTESWKLFYECLKSNNKTFSNEAYKGCLKCKQIIGAKVIFACVDLKLTDSGEIKILELGSGMLSALSGYDTLTDEPSSLLLEKELKYLHENVFVNALPGLEVSNSLIDEDLKNSLKDSEEFYPHNISSYQAIYGGRDLTETPLDVLKLNDVIVDSVLGNKVITNNCFNLAGLQEFRPKSLVLPKEKSNELVNEITENFPDTENFVLKLPTMERGEGVLIVEREHLETYLQFLFSIINKDGVYRACDNFYKNVVMPLNLSDEDRVKLFLQEKKLISNWTSPCDHSFIVEEYIHSKPLIKNNKNYDGTIRVAFVLSRDSGVFEFTPILSYWKLPPQPLNYHILRDKTISSFNETHLHSEMLSETDKSEVYKQLEEVLPKLFEQIINFDIENYISELVESSELVRNSKYNCWMALAKNSINHGELQSANHYLRLANNMEIQDGLHHYLQGLYYFTKEEYGNAIKMFSEAIKSNPLSGDSYFKRGHSYQKLENFPEAENDWYKAIEINPRYKILIRILLTINGMITDTPSNDLVEEKDDTGFKL